MNAPKPSTEALDFCYFHTADNQQALFSVNKGFDMLDALEHASALLDCAHRLEVVVACGEAGANEAHAAAYLSEMAKAVVDACLDGIRQLGVSHDQ